MLEQPIRRAESTNQDDVLQSVRQRGHERLEGRFTHGNMVRPHPQHLLHRRQDALDTWLEELRHVAPTKLQLPEAYPHILIPILGAAKFDVLRDAVVCEADLGRLVEASHDVVEVVEIVRVFEEV